MRIKPVMKKCVAPVFEEIGLLWTRADIEYVFKDAEMKRLVIFDTEKYYPKKLRVCFQARGQNYLRLMLSDLDPAFCPVSAESYSTQEELEVYLTKVAQATVAVVMPYLVALEPNYVQKTPEMPKALSEHTQERSVRFAKKYDLTLEPTTENAHRLNEIMNSMKTDVHHRKEDFLRHEEEIIDLCAYFGEMFSLRGEYPHLWTWRELCGHHLYVVKEQLYDPITRVLHAWNHGTEAITYSFQSF